MIMHEPKIMLASESRREFPRHLGALLAAVLCVAPATPTANADTEAVPDVIWGTYAIQNVQTGKNLRPYRAGKEDGNGLVLYDHWRWKCMTWQFARMAGDTYRLINRHTGKTFQASSDPRPGVSLWQKTVGGTENQEWVFLRQADGTWKIRLKGTELYLAISSPETNSPVVLMPKRETAAQHWRLLAQNPWI